MEHLNFSKNNAKEISEIMNKQTIIFVTIMLSGFGSLSIYDCKSWVNGISTARLVTT